ncbi:Sulfite exporter TauE/SafE [Roseovarius litorisediminis]|uniref:Probable membrane transporter protein n=1 Tax=Roseovarius litorisediminis TaxID=1312363 RepID=A0A1Y5T9I8_9RHOB|nr:sulfite exporter TauE/SafE family protein [Roseovarius litorisediminis]SLN58480.1 Sulfite exporter TauE/SafE [Roseovarius litorisediminis]
MDVFLQIGPLWFWALAFAIAMLAGVVKGVVGFAMPMVMISGLGSVVSPEMALAGLILPTLVTNLWQALRQGFGAAWGSVRRFRVFLITGGLVMLVSAQLVRVIPNTWMLLMLGVPITIYALLTLIGRPIRLSHDPGPRGEAVIGGVAGFFGGISGVWGPPTVVMLTARGTEIAEQMRIQGVIYGSGALLLLGAHIGSGVLRSETLPLSLAMVPPAVLGLWLGFRLQDRFDQKTFRKVTLAVLLLAGLNLVRRGLFAL